MRLSKPFRPECCTYLRIHPFNKLDWREVVHAGRLPVLRRHPQKMLSVQTRFLSGSHKSGPRNLGKNGQLFAHLRLLYVKSDEFLQGYYARKMERFDLVTIDLLWCVRRIARPPHQMDF